MIINEEALHIAAVDSCTQLCLMQQQLPSPPPAPQATSGLPSRILALRDEAREMLRVNAVQRERIKRLLQDVPATPSLAGRIARWLLNEQDTNNCRWRWSAKLSHTALTSGNLAHEPESPEALQMALKDPSIQLHLVPLVSVVLRAVLEHEDDLLRQQGDMVANICQRSDELCRVLRLRVGRQEV